MNLDNIYEEKVYSGVLGKIIGVYLGRPFEQWTYNRILKELGYINYYVNTKLNIPLHVTDDDITGTFTFLRSLKDFNYNKNITPKQIGQTWINNLIEGQTILWWGGKGHSTEHTAYQNLKENIKPIQDASQKILSMNPVTHTWIKDKTAPAQHGFIAQEMQSIVPEAVSGDEDSEEMMQMDYGRITPVIVKSLQDALNEIMDG